MNLCRTTSGKSERCSQQFRLLSVYLFLWLEHGIDKLLIRDMAVEMSLCHIIVYLELDVLKKFLSDPCPDVERRIPVIGDIDADKLSTGREAVTLRVCLAVKLVYLLPLSVYDGILLLGVLFGGFRPADGCVYLFLVAVPQLPDVRLVPLLLIEPFLPEVP